MAHQYQSRDEFVKSPRHSRDSQDLRVILAEYILNFEFPRDVYTILITLFTIYLAIKLLRFFVSVFGALIRPIIFLVLILIVLPYFYEMKYGIASNRMMSNMYTHTEGFFQNVGRMLNSIYTHTIQFYAKNF